MHNSEILQVLPHDATKLCFPQSQDLAPRITIPTWWESSTPITWEYFPPDDKEGLSTFLFHAFFPLLLTGSGRSGVRDLFRSYKISNQHIIYQLHLKPAHVSSSL